jgi:chromosome segregation ATPase
MAHVQDQLEKKRAEFSTRMDECKYKQEELRTKQKQIRDRVLKFEKFLKENDAKRQRANIKAQTERKSRELKEAELANLHVQLHEIKFKAERIGTIISIFKKLILEKHQIYEHYLQLVVDSIPPDYLDINEPHINDVLMRHKTLLETNEDLIKTVQNFQDSIENEQNKLTNIVKVFSNA